MKRLPTPTNAKGHWDRTKPAKPTSGAPSAEADGSAASLKAEIGAWKEATQNCRETYLLQKRTLTSLLDLMERMCRVMEHLETKEPPNVPDQPRLADRDNPMKP